LGGRLVFGFLRALARILFGLILASLAAGLVTVLFVDIDVLAGPLERLPKTLAETIDLALLAATHIAIFSFVFVMIIAVIGEWLSIRKLAFYLVMGVAIAFLGFSAQYASEVAGQATIFNSYAIRAFLTVGFVGGFVYWLAAGQFAGRPGPENKLEISDTTAVDTETTQLPSSDRVNVVIARPPTIEARQHWRMPKLERLRFSKRSTPSDLEGESSSESDDGGTVLRN
jgi:hypothetical protein